MVNDHAHAVQQPVDVVDVRPEHVRQLGFEAVHVDALACHARLVGRLRRVVAVAREVLRLHAGQRDRFATLERRINRQQVIIGDGHRHAAHQFVELIDAADVHADIAVDLRAIVLAADLHQVFHRPDGVAVVFLPGATVGVRKADLHFPRPGIQTVDIHQLNLRHRIAVKLQLMNLVVHMVKHQQQQEVRLTAQMIRRGCILVNLAVVVVIVADQQHGGQIRGRTCQILFAVLRPRRKEAEGIRHRHGNQQQHARQQRKKSSPSSGHSSFPFLYRMRCMFFSALHALRPAFSANRYNLQYTTNRGVCQHPSWRSSCIFRARRQKSPPEKSGGLFQSDKRPFPPEVSGRKRLFFSARPCRRECLPPSGHGCSWR